MLSRLKDWRVIILIIIILGSIASIYFYTTLPKPRKPLIGVITVYGYLVSFEDRQLYLKAITYALKNDTIRGVIVVVDSPGGYASMAEDLYYSLKKLDKEKPVVTLVEGLAASGGYMVALGGRHIIAEPSSFVGNIGVIVVSPFLVIPSEKVYDTGPYKFTGFSVKEFPKLVKDALNNFLDAVKESRGNKLKVSLKELSLGKLYLGSEAFKLGLVDELGSMLTAVKRLCEYSGIREYEIIDLLKTVSNISEPLFGYTTWKNSTHLTVRDLIKYSKSPVGVYYLSPYFVTDYIRSGAITQSFPQNWYYTSNVGDLKNAILVDDSHKNYFNPALYGEFFGKVVEKGGRVVIVSKDMDLVSLLEKKPKALIIFTPLTKYSEKEVEAIKKYLEKGGKLVIIYDTSLASASVVNDFSQNFGIYFSEGYLYNTENNYWIYRNIYVDKLEKHPLFQNVTKLVFFTATTIYTNATPLAKTYATLSLTEKPGNYTVIALNKNVLAIADQTFIADPYLYAEDNYNFLNNLINYLLNKKE